jgi:AmmeMemoRadiSam system protein A
MQQLVNLAKKTVETFIEEGKIISPPEGLSEEFLKRKAGTFVTIEKNGNLRGCIGTYLPTRENIAEEVIQNAIAAATEDWRFGPVEKEELPYLSYTVYILNEPELVKDLKELDPKKYGVIVKTVPIVANLHEFEHEYTRMDVVFNGHFVPKTGLLLPDLEGVDTIEKQISIACQKAGIDPEREKFLIYRFTVEKYQ